MNLSKTNEPTPRAFVRFSPSNSELDGTVPKEWIVNANVFFGRAVGRRRVSPQRRTRAIAQATAFLRDDGGATMVEYAFMVMLIAIVCVATVSTIGTKLNTVYNAVSNDF